jgi:hypothetical protein
MKPLSDTTAFFGKVYSYKARVSSVVTVIIVSALLACIATVANSPLKAAASTETNVYLEECLSVSSTQYGKRCGSADSFLVVAVNSCEQNLRGYISVENKGGTWLHKPTGLLKPGEKIEAFVCSGTGNYKVKSNTGTDPSYPNPNN